MAGLSYYMEKIVLDYMFGNVTPPSKDDHYYAFCIAEPTKNGIIPGTELMASFDTPNRGHFVSETAAWVYTTFNQTTPAKYFVYDVNHPNLEVIIAPSGPITSVAIMDAATGGNMLASTRLTKPLHVREGDKIQLLAGGPAGFSANILN